jgi:hypothetical protein
MSNGAQAMGGAAPAVMPGASTYAPQVAPGPQPGSLGGGKGGAAGATPFQQSADAMRASLGGTGREMMYTPLGVQAGGGYKAATAGGGGQVGGNWGYDPTMIDGGGYSARQLAGQDLSSYMNPYEDRGGQTSRLAGHRPGSTAGRPTRRTALCHGRRGLRRSLGEAVMQAENNRNFLDQQARTASGLRQAGLP